MCFGRMSQLCGALLLTDSYVWCVGRGGFTTVLITGFFQDGILSRRAGGAVLQLGNFVINVDI